ncbi:hypothetical protein T06_1588 [Trichinella sp. T6]|nr:hypothetical protein T06_1588 [Trichinella sp. T6]
MLYSDSKVIPKVGDIPPLRGGGKLSSDMTWQSVFFIFFAHSTYDFFLPALNPMISLDDYLNSLFENSFSGNNLRGV